MTLTNREIADIIETIADMLEIKGEIIHRVPAVDLQPHFDATG